jgi:hypothetical protein
MKTKIRDLAGLSGYVRVWVNGRLHWEGPNLIVNTGLNYTATLLAGFATVTSPTQYETIDTVLIGNGGCDTAGTFSAGLVATPTVPVPPVRADTTLVSQITNTPLLNVSAAVLANNAIFNATLQADTLVNADFPDFGSIGIQALFVNELGLYVSAPVSAMPSLFARVCVPSIAFAPTSGTTISIEWTVGVL